MSMAFLRDDAEGEMPRRHYDLPAKDDPDYDRAAARAMLEAARVGETQLAERATGYYWGEPALRPYVDVILAEAEKAGDDRLEQVARRFLRYPSTLSLRRPAAKSSRLPIVVLAIVVMASSVKKA